MPHDTIILGLGSMGSAAAYACAQRGLKVLGLEQFPLVHNLGSSHGHSRIIRELYYEHPAYVPLAQQSFHRWQQLEKETGQSLLARTPCANIGPTGSEIILGVQRAAQEHQLEIQTWDHAQIQKNLPQFRLPDNYLAVIEPTAGWLRVEACVQAQLDMAQRHGADLHASEKVLSWTSTGNSVQVTTTQATYSAGQLIITAGPWARQALAGLNLPLTVMRQTQLWFAEPDSQRYRTPHFPIFIVDTPQGSFYGIPADAGPGVKLAQHYGAPELPSPNLINRTLHESDLTPVRDFLRTYLPELADGPLVHHAICIYTLSPDRHFIIDRHPEHNNVALAAGFSGHGFKFAPTIGEMLVDLAENPNTQPLDLFRLTRFQN